MKKLLLTLVLASFFLLGCVENQQQPQSPTSTGILTAASPSAPTTIKPASPSPTMQEMDPELQKALQELDEILDVQ